MTDPITDLLNRIRNAQAVFHPTVDIPFSQIKYRIIQILAKEGFIEKFEKKGKKAKKIIRITLKYIEKTSAEGEARQRRPAISNLKRISKPGQRIYLSYKKIKKVRGGYGMVIVSTPEGLMTDREIRKQKLGGEVICEIW
ncbi:30S ribosomal protein S8 [Patescibacteria group bacterium]|nr:30S ribosomal protein S8 [Patescibacteria group bacterium]